MTIESLSKQIAEEFDNSVAKAFVLSVWKLLRDNGINVCLSQREVECIKEQREKEVTWRRDIELDFRDIDTFEHDKKIKEKVIEDVINEIRREYPECGYVADWLCFMNPKNILVEENENGK